jgi:hypothetical protein
MIEKEEVLRAVRNYIRQSAEEIMQAADCDDGDEFDGVSVWGETYAICALVNLTEHLEELFE